MTPISRISIRPQNTDLRWYRDKYLTLIFIFAFVGGLLLVWGWPPPRENLIRGLEFLGVAALCLVVSPQRLRIFAGAMGFIFIRGLLGLVLYRSVGALIVGLAAGAVFYLLATHGKLSRSLNYVIKDYSHSEFAIDMAVFCFLLWLGIKVT